jgi:hypothetical protein
VVGVERQNSDEVADLLELRVQDLRLVPSSHLSSLIQWTDHDFDPAVHVLALGRTASAQAVERTLVVLARKAGSTGPPHNSRNTAADVLAAAVEVAAAAAVVAAVAVVDWQTKGLKKLAGFDLERAQVAAVVGRSTERSDPSYRCRRLHPRAVVAVVRSTVHSDR